jgi:gliding motility-associated lipoprotein GldH
MKRYLILFCLVVFSAFLLALPGCIDNSAIIDQNSEIPNHNWTYLNKFKYDVNINDEKTPYNLYLNLRVTSDYKYSNIFVLITEAGPGKKTEVNRFEVPLANKDGEWLGKGSGNLYSYQAPFLTNYKFPAKGTYHFYIEQNMRDNPLREVSDVGLRVEKAAP